MTHDKQSKRRSGSLNKTYGNSVPVVQRMQSRSQKARVVALSTHNNPDGTPISKRKKKFVL